MNVSNFSKPNKKFERKRTQGPFFEPDDPNTKRRCTSKKECNVDMSKNLMVLGSADRHASTLNNSNDCLPSTSGTCCVQLKTQTTSPTNNNTSYDNKNIPSTGNNCDMFSTSLNFASLPATTESFLTPLFVSLSHFTPTSAPLPPEPKTATRNLNNPVFALAEGRGAAMGEVGLAVMDSNFLKVQLCQYPDSQCFPKTIAKLNICQPVVLLVPDSLTCQKSALLSNIQQAFPDMEIVTEKRCLFSREAGYKILELISFKKCSSTLLILQEKYYALAAVSALLQFLEKNHNFSLSPNSLHVEFDSPEGTTFIDFESARRLEIVSGNKQSYVRSKFTLFNVLNHCKTISGQRKMRMLLLQPPAKLSEIMKRQEAVEFLVHDQVLLSTLQSACYKFSETEKLLWLLNRTPNFKSEQSTCENMTKFVLVLKQTLNDLPLLFDVLGDAQHDYFMDIREVLCDEIVSKLKLQIDNIINDDAKPVKGFSACELQRCFSIKTGVNGLLDVARSTYSNLIGLIQENIDSLVAETCLPLKICHSADLGFHISITMSKNSPRVHESFINNYFIKVKDLGYSIRCTSKVICSLNLRINRVLQDIYQFSNVILFDLIKSLKESSSFIYKFCEVVGDLDVTCSLASVSSSNNFVKPTFADFIQIKGARHPLIDLTKSKIILSTPIFSTKKENVTLILGPNMSGKSTTCSALLLFQIMAQIGCFLPAESAEMKVVDHIALRRGNNDCLENKLSSFSMEVKELTNIINCSGPKSLIVIDEIAQGTSYFDGLSLAWVVLETFLNKSSFLFVVSHHKALSQLKSLYNHLNIITLQRRSGFKGCSITSEIDSVSEEELNVALKIMAEVNIPAEFVHHLSHYRSHIRQISETMDDSDLINLTNMFLLNLLYIARSNEFNIFLVSGLQKMAEDKIMSLSNVNLSGYNQFEDSDEECRPKRRKLESRNLTVTNSADVSIDLPAMPKTSLVESGIANTEKGCSYKNSGSNEVNEGEFLDRRPVAQCHNIDSARGIVRRDDSQIDQDFLVKKRSVKPMLDHEYAKRSKGPFHEDLSHGSDKSEANPLDSGELSSSMANGPAADADSESVVSLENMLSDLSLN